MMLMVGSGTELTNIMDTWIISRGSSKTTTLVMHQIYRDMEERGIKTLEEWICSFDDPVYVAGLLARLGVCPAKEDTDDDNDV